MSWVDFLPFVIVIIIGAIESNRGFGLALFDLLGGVIIIKIALFLGEAIGQKVALGPSKETSEGYCLLLAFIVLGVLVLLGSKLLYQNTLFSLDALDPIVGGLFGIGSGLILSHVILKSLGLIAHQTAFGDLVVGSFAYHQFVTLDGFHSLMDKMLHFGDMPAQ